MQKDLDRLEGDYLGNESKYHSLNIQSEINEVLSSFAVTELAYKSSADKKLSGQFKCYHDWFNSYISEQEAKLKTLRVGQKEAKVESDVNSSQISLFNNLLRILQTKAKSGGGQQQLNNQGEDRLVL